MSSFWLQKRKKAELVAFCHQLGIETDGYLKSDVEEVLGNYLQEHQSELSNDSTFAPYYDTIAARSPYKSIATREDAGQKRQRRRTNRFVPGTSTFENAATPESTPDPGTERKLRSSSRAPATRTPRTTRSLRQAGKIPLPPSPAVVADEIESRTNALVASARRVVRESEIKDKAVGLRDRFSNVISVNATSLTVEVLFLLLALIPRTYEMTLPGVAALKVEPYTYIVPDLFVLLTASFWAPFLTWLLTALVVPVTNATLFNLVATTVITKDGNERKADPLTFAVTKALVAYLVHYKGFTFGGLFHPKTVAVVGTSVGRDLQLINASIGGIAALWEGILKR